VNEQRFERLTFWTKDFGIDLLKLKVLLGQQDARIEQKTGIYMNKCKEKLDRI
jgi:hypothetical protein